MDQVMELRIKPRRLRIRHAENSGQNRENQHEADYRRSRLDVRLECVCELSVGQRVGFRRDYVSAGDGDAGIAFASYLSLRRRLI
jgi:hypothetical protein